jgi:hypothetical protein
MSGAGECAHCATPLVAPDAGPRRIGQVVEMGNRLLSKKGIVIADDGQQVTVASKADAPLVVPATQFDAFAPVPVAGPEVIGAAGRLWRANQAKNDGSIKAKWTSETIESAAAGFASANLASTRAAALDAIALGLTDQVDRLPLSPTEIAWYRACAYASTGDVPALVASVEALPAHGFHGRVPLLLGHVAALYADPALAARARVLLDAFVADDPDARALSVALAPSPDAGVLELSSSYADRLESLGASPAQVMAAIPDAIARHQRFASLPATSTATPNLRSLDAYLAGRGGTVMDAALPALAGLPVTLLDELIDVGTLTRIPADAQHWPPAITAYLRCRTNPAEATVDELRLAGFHAELARRFMLSADDAELATLDDSDAAVGHYRAVRAYQLSRTLADADRLRPSVRTVFEQIEALRQTAPGQRGDAQADLAADSSAWPLIREMAYRGDVSLDADLRARFPNFGAWLDLCGMQRLVFDGRWAEVITAGRRLASSPLESMRDEAESMVAFAEWQLGHPAEALRVLDDALSGQFSTGLIVNAALVAAEQGCRPAFPYLIKAMRLATDPRVRQGAVSRAIALWLGDDTVQDYPDVLARMVRESLAIMQPDDGFHSTLLFISTLHDRDWLATAAVAAANPAQTNASRYFATRSRVLSDAHPDTLDDLGNMLVKLAQMSPPYDWVTREKTWLTELLLDLVHTDFGDAAWTSSVIATLVGGGILDLAEELVLGMQAGAHVAMKLNGEEAEISADAEQRLVFAHVDKYRLRRGELNEVQQEIVDDEVAHCAVAASLAFVATTERAVDAFQLVWGQLVDRERWDYQNRAYIIGQERRALNSLAPYVDRCRRYLAMMDGLKLSETGRARRDQMVSSVNLWASEIARLRSLL